MSKRELNKVVPLHGAAETIKPSIPSNFHEALAAPLIMEDD